MSTGMALLVAGGAGLVLLCLVGVIAGVVGSHSNSDSTSPPPAPAVTTTQAAPKPPSAARALVDWWNGGAKDRAAAIGSDFDKLGTAASNNNYSAVRGACAQAQKDVEAAQAYGPVPDAQGQSLWAAALASYARASTDCISGVEAHNTALLLKSTDEINAGNVSAFKLAARIKELGNGG